nr:formin-like protein 6 [Aegilops tauschii subsp. strangulata]
MGEDAVPAPAPTTVGRPRPCWSLRLHALPRLRPLLVTSAAGPAPASAPPLDGCFHLEAMGEVTCGEVVGKVSGPCWLLRPPAPPSSTPCWLLPPATRRPPPTGPAPAGFFRRRPPPPGRKT